MAKFNFKSFKQKVKDNYQKVVNYTAVGGVAVASSMAHAEALDMSQGTTQLALGLAAVGALGAAKLAPSALSWVWSLVTRNASRG